MPEMTGRVYRSALVLGILCLLAVSTAGQLRLEFFEEDYSVVEGGSATVTVVKTGANVGTLTLQIVPLTYDEFAASGDTLPPEISTIIDDVSPTAAQFDSSPGGRRDFSNQAMSVTIPPSLSDVSMDLIIGTMEDFINEAVEGLLLQIRVDQIDPADQNSLTLVRNGVALVRIIDDDAIRISFLQAQYSVEEDGGVVSDMVAIGKDGGVQSEQNLTVMLNIQGSTAIADQDFVSFPDRQITFQPSDISFFVPFEVIDDSDPEDDEVFLLQISLPQDTPLSPPSISAAAVTIVDNDGMSIEVGFRQDSYTVTEGETVTVVYEILSDRSAVPTTEFASFTLEIFPSTAMLNEDYNPGAFSSLVFLDTFAPEASIDIPTIDDSEVEGTEEFILRLTLMGGGFTEGDFEVVRSQTTVFIQDNEPGGGGGVLELMPVPVLEGIEGDTVTFSCGPLGASSITLLVNGQPDSTVGFDDGTGNRTFTVGPLTRDMNGTTFQCIAGTLSSEITTLVVYFPPQYTVGPFFRGNEGDLLSISLQLDGFPLPVDGFVWTFNGQPLMAEPGRLMFGGDFIEFTPLRRGAMGTYTVTATNLAGSDTATFNVEANYPPEYTNDPVYRPLEGEPATILLGLDASPLPGPTEFTWSFNGQPLVPSSNLDLTVSSLSWGAVTRQDSGMYAVEASNRAGTGNTSFIVDVIYPPTYTVTDPVIVIEGDAVRVPFTLDANPTPSTFSWTFAGGPLTMPPTGGDFGVDFIDFGPSISRSASGVYSIESTNDAGTGNASFQLTVYYPPTYTVDSTFSVVEGETFDLPLDLDALPLPTSNNVTWFFNGQLLNPLMPGIMLGTDFIRISMVTRLDEGTYRVEARNEVGMGSASFQLQVTVPASTPGPMATTMIPVPTTTVSMATTTDLVPDPTRVLVSGTPGVTLPASPAMDPTPFPTTDPPATTVFGDPHFSVLLPSGQLLCYSVQGEHGYSFNLVSNRMLQINARFVRDARREEVTWIGSLGIVITSRKMNKTRIRFEAEEKAIYIGEKLSLHAKKIDKLTFSGGKLKISEALRSKKEKHLCVEVELTDLGLVFTVDFVRDHLDMTWRKVGRQPPTSHGIIGQFFRGGVEIDEVRRLLVLPDMEPVAVMRKPVWHFMERDSPDEQLCWVAMNPGYQGKKLLQGHYLDYLVDDVLATNFKFKPKKPKKARKSI